MHAPLPATHIAAGRDYRLVGSVAGIAIDEPVTVRTDATGQMVVRFSLDDASHNWIVDSDGIVPCVGHLCDR